MLKKLREQLEAIRTEAKAILTKADNESEGILSNEQTTDYDAKLEKIETIKANIEQRVKMDTIDTDLAKPQPRAIAPGQADPARKLEIKEGEADPTGGYANIAQFAMDVKSACMPGGVQTAQLAKVQAQGPDNPHVEVGSSEGGFMVPSQYRDEIWEIVTSEVDLLTIVDVEPTSSNSVTLPADETTPWSTAGVQANWRSEASQMDETKLDTEARIVPLHELYAFVTATEELLEDAPRLNDRLMRKAPKAIRWKASDSFVNGTGAGQPLGWFNSGNAPALVSIAKESGQVADTVVAENVAKMIGRIAGLGDSFWLINSDVLPQIVLMTLGGQPIWTPPREGFTGAPGGFLFGRPIIDSEHAQTVGDQGDIQLVNPKGYYATRKAAGIKFASSQHLFFNYNTMAFRWTFRLGGQSYLTAPYAKNNGPNTKSHFVVLDERT